MPFSIQCNCTSVNYAVKWKRNCVFCSWNRFSLRLDLVYICVVQFDCKSDNNGSQRISQNAPQVVTWSELTRLCPSFEARLLPLDLGNLWRPRKLTVRSSISYPKCNSDLSPGKLNVEGNNGVIAFLW